MEAFVGGTARHLVDLTCGLEGWDHSVIVSLRREPRMVQSLNRLRKAGVRVEVVPMSRQISPLADWWAFQKIVSLLREIRPDIVHCHSAKGGFLGRAAGHVAQIPVRLYTPHALPFHSGISPVQSLVYGALERLASRWTTGLIAVSPSEAEAVLDAKLIDPSRVRVIPNGVAIPTLPRDKAMARRYLNIPVDRPLVVCIAHLRPQKAPLDWLAMARRALQDRPDCLFAWIGDGPLEKELLREARTLGSSFLYLGYQADPSWALQAADVFTLASLWEGCPYVLLDAMAWKIPCAVTAVAGCRDAIQNGVNGLLSPPGEPEKLARNVLQFLNNPVMAHEMGCRAYETVQQHFSFETFLVGHDRVYREMIGLEK